MEPSRDREWRISNSNTDHEGNKRKAVENGMFGSLEPALWSSAPSYQAVEMTNVPLFGRTISQTNHHYPLNQAVGTTKKAKPNENHSFLPHPYCNETLLNPENGETSNSFISFASLYKPEDSTPVPNLNNISFGTYPDQNQQFEAISSSSSTNIVQFGQTSTTKPQKEKDPKPPKKPSSNNFPSNVKSLLSTGMLDGVPVKYVSWSREKSLVGSIQGTGYLCGCGECKFEKSLNAYEFERHANCKTKHPNNHIYFENGKTIYAVVQELKSTPQELLFDVIQTVTGSTINMKNFNIWKASYQAATRELQRIYGKDDIKRD